MYQAASTGVCSPVLSNVYLDKLDQYVETVLLPAYNPNPYPQIGGGAQGW